jgi:hypothetical protein
MLAINKKTPTTEKIFRRAKRLRDHMQPGEEPLLAVAAIWDNGQEQHSTPCEVIVTNQRLLGYYSVNFPRKRFFLDDLSLAAITSVTLRHKTYEPLFRELLVRDSQRKVYIRAPRRYIEALFAALRLAAEEHAPTTQAAFEDQSKETEKDTARRAAAPAYGRQDIRTSFEGSPLAITLLFVGGIALEILGFVLWGVTQSAQVGIPLFIAGLIAVLAATFVKRQKR